MHMASNLDFILFFWFLFSPSSSALACNVFILAGQSNMVGRGGVGNINGTYGWDRQTPPECQPNPQILRLNDELSWEEAKEPLHEGISFAKCLTNKAPFGIGPGMPFANSILEREAATGIICLVPCAVGNTNISQWRRGSCLYDRLLTRVRAAMMAQGVLRGMLWYQGENDVNPCDAKLYKGRLEEFFADVRADLLSPSLPIIQVALASGGVAEVRDIVRNAQLHTDVRNVKCVDAKGLPLNGDKLHLQTGSQVRLGTMLADTYLHNFNYSLASV